jgi:hypothetical protein
MTSFIGMSWNEWIDYGVLHTARHSRFSSIYRPVRIDDWPVISRSSIILGGIVMVGSSATHSVKQKLG